MSKKVTVYSKPNCVNCNKTYDLLGKLDASYESIDISKDKAALKKIKELGFREAPVVVINDGEDSWSGFNESKIREHLDENSETEDDDTWDF